MTVKKGLLVLAILAGLIYPFVSTQHYQLHQFSMVFAYVILLLGLNVLVGKSGQISMGHTAFYAIGAYTTTLMMTRLHTGFYITIVPSVALCFIAGILFGLPVQGLSFIYLMLATLALGVSIPQLLKRFSEFTGGVGGIVVPEPTIPSFIPVAMDVWMYLLCFIAMLFVLWITWNLMRGYIGRAMMAIRDNSVAAAAMGVNVAYYKTMTFGFSAALAGLTGSLTAATIQYVAPDMFSFAVVLLLIVALLVGGVGFLSGAIYSAIFMQFVPEWTVDIYKGAPSIILAILLILIAYFMPGGISFFVHKWTSKLSEKLNLN